MKLREEPPNLEYSYIILLPRYQKIEFQIIAVFGILAVAYTIKNVIHCIFVLCVLGTKINILILFYEKVFVFPFRIFNPLALWALPLYFLTATPRNATGHGRGRGLSSILYLLL